MMMFQWSFAASVSGVSLSLYLLWSVVNMMVFLWIYAAFVSIVNCLHDGISVDFHCFCSCCGLLLT